MESNSTVKATMAKMVRTKPMVTRMMKERKPKKANKERSAPKLNELAVKQLRPKIYELSIEV